jgi:hypothetical protein
VQEGFQGFEVDWMLHDPCEDLQAGIKLEAIDNKNLVIVNGAKIQIWTSVSDKKWGIKAEFNYQGLSVIQINSNIKYRLGT